MKGWIKICYMQFCVDLEVICARATSGEVVDKSVTLGNGGGGSLDLNKREARTQARLPDVLDSERLSQARGSSSETTW